MHIRNVIQSSFFLCLSLSFSVFLFFSLFFSFFLFFSILFSHFLLFFFQLFFFIFLFFIFSSLALRGFPIHPPFLFILFGWVWRGVVRVVRCSPSTHFYFHLVSLFRDRGDIGNTGRHKKGFLFLLVSSLLHAYCTYPLHVLHCCGSPVSSVRLFVGGGLGGGGGVW